MNKKCQVFTPKNYVKELLDSVGYTHNLYGKKVLENSCGDGNILAVVVQRYIEDCFENGLSRTKIKNGLARDIYGIEIDKEQKEKCIARLNNILVKNNIKPVSWKIFDVDYLKWGIDIKFQYIIGNPPYITYSELGDDDRKYVKEKYNSCKKGKFDYCYAFIEKSIDELDVDGKMSYLIPSSIFKTVFGKSLRCIMKKYIMEIRDYPLKKIFDEALVKSSIIVLNKNRQQDYLRYREMSTQKVIDISLNGLGDKWFFTDTWAHGQYRFGDFFRVSHVVATLLNEAYVLSNGSYIEVEDGYISEGIMIERNVIRSTDTPRSLRYNKNEKIIFPYRYNENGIVHFNEDEFEQNFPGATAYLMKFRDKLDKRKKDNNARWFEYGRSQALKGLNCSKLLMSTVITNVVEISELSQECIPYAGMYIAVKNDNSQYTLSDAEKVLSSDAFLQYVKNIGIPISGQSVRITSKDVEDYKFDSWRN